MRSLPATGHAQHAGTGAVSPRITHRIVACAAPCNGLNRHRHLEPTIRAELVDGIGRRGHFQRPDSVPHQHPRAREIGEIVGFPQHPRSRLARVQGPQLCRQGGRPLGRYERLRAPSQLGESFDHVFAQPHDQLGPCPLEQLGRDREDGRFT
ncbi:hypothetical protein ACIBSV_24500 [Embleya sp. NPDC050154]|uniref:hypothetical protein n=1 Tax=Embleya sp. NPDC050154 TaxID=3363988 RepID=UPI0037B4E17E